MKKDKKDTMIYDETVPGKFRYNETETRRKILNIGKFLKIEGDVIAVLNKYDRALAKCTNLSERKMIAEMGAAEIQKLFDGKDELLVNGKKII